MEIGAILVEDQSFVFPFCLWGHSRPTNSIMSIYFFIGTDWLAGFLHLVIVTRRRVEQALNGQSRMKEMGSNEAREE